MLGFRIRNLNIFIILELQVSSTTQKIIFGEGILMNGLECIYDVKVNVNCVKDDDFYVRKSYKIKKIKELYKIK